MKHLCALVVATLLAGYSLVACSTPLSPSATLMPTSTDLPAPTLASPTSPASPTANIEPPLTPTPSPIPGTALTFDRLSMIIPSALAAGASGTLVPEATSEDVAPWDVAPQHIQLKLDGYMLEGKLHQPQIYVYPAQAYAQLQERGTAAQSLVRLQAVLMQSSMVDLKALPEVPFFNVSAALAAQVKVIPFQNGRGVRMLTQYGMGHAIINNQELFYHFEGLTGDGQYYVIAILPVTAPGLPDDGQPGSVVPPGGVSVPDFNDMNANWMGYFGEVRQMLQDCVSDAFTPNLNQLDALIASLAISTTN